MHGLWVSRHQGATGEEGANGTGLQGSFGQLVGKEPLTRCADDEEEGASWHLGPSSARPGRHLPSL